MKLDLDNAKSPSTETLIPTKTEVAPVKAKSEKPLSQTLKEIPDVNTADKKTTKAIVADEKQKRKAYLAELEGQRKAADEQAYMNRRAEEFEKYNAKIESDSILGQA